MGKFTNTIMKKISKVVSAFQKNDNDNQKSIFFETEGNLEAPNPCDCVELSEVTNKHNPADILIGMGKCIELKEFEKAVKLYAIAGVYGKYDTYRVMDETAHQALLILQQNVLSKLSEEDKEKLISYINKFFNKGSKELKSICQAIQKIGITKYFPRYMIQHGLQSFTNIEGNGLVENFNSREAWELALKSYLHCDE